MERLLTPEQAAEYLQVAKRTIYKWLQEGRIAGVKAGSLWRIPETALEKFIDANRKR